MLVLAGCTTGGQFDPTELFNNDAFDSKKKLKGDRELVFPNGVPGTTTGVPADLVKGYQPPPDQIRCRCNSASSPQRRAATAEKPKAKTQAQAEARRSAGAAPGSSLERAAGGIDAAISVNPTASTRSPYAQAPQASSAQTALAGAAANGTGQQGGQPSQSIWPNPPAPAQPNQ